MSVLSNIDYLLQYVVNGIGNINGTIAIVSWYDVNTANICVLLTTYFSYTCSIFIIVQIIITKKYKSPSHVSNFVHVQSYYEYSYTYRMCSMQDKVR